MSPIIDDTIGNRQDSTEGTAGPVYYCANSVNQYTYLDDASGTCPTPPTPTETLVHDADGNLTQDDTFDYAWDAENRLVAVQTRLDLGADDENPDEGDKLVEFKYDHMNRRVEKRYRVYTSGAWADQTHGWIRFVYDEWNVIVVLDASDSNAALKKYTWGLDLSGLSGNASVSGIHNAGGIGGLLAVEETATGGTPAYWYLYDANGNVGQLVENTTGYPIAATYEYSPFGKVIASGGSYAGGNPFRFSTKWLDDELAASGQTGAVGEDGLYYYGYRYYSPELGRWIKRDPIGEAGGMNTLAFVGNIPTGTWDPLGLEGCGSEDSEWVPDNPLGCPFKSCCDDHDNCYGTCHLNKALGKLSCDIQFGACMDKASSSRCCKSLAELYFTAVLEYGQGAYDAAQKEACEPEPEAPACDEGESLCYAPWLITSPNHPWICYPEFIPCPTDPDLPVIGPRK